MSKINILPPAVFNKIAAGEVIERPASIVKELIENSIDAGATRINLEITNGGISQIAVSDNGSGILPEDLEKAFLPHATSKISKAEDLESIGTLGFRGEALASIASVAQVTLTSKTKDNLSGGTIEVNGGVMGEKGEKGSPDGTYICVNNIFYNVPVRAKFLKRPKQEEGEITTLVSRLILANPDIAIKYVADGKTIYNSQGTGLNDAIFSIYGASTMQCIIPVHSIQNDYKIDGFSSKTSYFKSNRTYQTLIINGRYVNNYLISQAVSRAYEKYMMKQAFPFYVLNMTIPTDELDVNVHPTKMEVRFSNPQSIFGFVFNSITSAINKFLVQSAPTEFSSSLDNVEKMVATRDGQSILDKPEQEIKKINSDDELKSLSKVLFNFDTSSTSGDKMAEGASTMGEILIEKLKTRSIDSFSSNNANANPDRSTDILEPKPIQQQILDDDTIADDAMLSSKVIGKVFNTFVFVEQGDKLYIIDQHAAHERLLYDLLVENLNSKQIKKQGLLIPYIFNVNYQEEEFLNNHLEMLNELGFELQPFGNLSFKVDTVPNVLCDIEIGKFFNTVLANVNSYLTIKTEDVLRDTLAQHACKHAVKGGDDLNKEELVSLVKKVSKGEITLQCPHGRPFIIEWSRNDFDKWFKRKL